MAQSKALVHVQSTDSFLDEIISNSKQDVSAVVPDDLDGREVLALLGRCRTSLINVDKAKSFLIPVLGKILSRASKDHLYETAGYDSLEAFIQGELITKGVSRSTVFDAKKIYEWAPELSLEEQVSVGRKKLLAAARNMPDASPEQKRKLLTKAKELTEEKFKAHVENITGQEAGSTTGAMFPLIGNAAQVRELKEELAEPQFIEYAGTNQPIGQILAAIAECKTVWPVEADEERRLIHVKAATKEEPEPEPEINW